jgi:hypothetical protein
VKDYLEAIVVEQINRSLALKNFIRYPLQYSELAGLAERCTRILDDQIRNLKELESMIETREENDLRDIFRDVRVCGMEIALVEYYGIPPLYYQTPEIGFLNRLTFKIHGEIKLPLPHPAICGGSGEHYFSHPFTNVIFVPLGESEFLLHMPDLYHEIGHYLLENRDADLRLETMTKAFDSCFMAIARYYTELMKTKKREGAPQGIQFAISRCYSQWKNWIVEFFCDLFALYTVGPAYAWSHIHLTLKRSKDIYELDMLQNQTHPADEARMRILEYGLKNLGYEAESGKMHSKWAEISKFWSNPPSEYQYAYPDSLLADIARLSLEGLQGSSLSVAYPKVLSTNTGEIRFMLNTAWEVFWKSPKEFRTWEVDQLSSLRRSLTNPI